MKKWWGNVSLFSNEGADGLVLRSWSEPEVLAARFMSAVDRKWPPPVAWMDDYGGVVTAAMKNRDPGLPYPIPLFTHPPYF